ncbi:hypothetical protein ACP4OV_005347 [Aristida adscensionis]
MDDLVHHSFSFFSSTAGNPVIEFVFCEVPEQWLLDDDNDDDVHLHDQDGGSDGDDLSGKPPAKKRRGRKPGPQTDGPTVSHVEAERQRRDKLNRRFYELRAAVPTVTRMDRASLLADAASYIADLRRRVEQLEAEARHAVAAAPPFAAADDTSSSTATAAVSHTLWPEETLEMRMVGREAAVLRLTTTTTAAAAARHAPARLMDALRRLDLPVQHACVCRVGGVTVQDAVVDVPDDAALRDEGCLRAALLERLQKRRASSWPVHACSLKEKPPHISL